MYGYVTCVRCKKSIPETEAGSGPRGFLCDDCELDEMLEFPPDTE